MMEINRVSAEEYKNYFADFFHVFNSVDFSELNKSKCEMLHYLVFRDKKVRLGIIMGERENILYSPFSAPFGCFSYVKLDTPLEFMEEAVKLLENYARTLNKSLKISLMPSIYNPSLVAKEISVFSRSLFALHHVDLNYHFEVKNIACYEKIIARSARKNLHNSLKQCFDFDRLDSNKMEDVKRVYRVIRVNRESKGYPLRMTLENVLDTIRVVKADFFLLSLNSDDVAAAQVFHVSENVVQVIYWGDIPGFAEFRVMNYLAYKVFEYYASVGVKIVDIGPSTENGNPNYGLCEFKENIGCDVSMKNTYILCHDAN